MTKEHINDIIKRAEKLKIPTGIIVKEYERIAQAYAVKGEKPDAFDYNIAYITIKDKYKTT